MRSQTLWGEKPYYSLDFRLRRQFGEKVYRLSLNGGMTCPNRDGTIGTGGCIFCSAGGSGDFAADKGLSITEQIQSQKEALRGKKPAKKYIAYFQAYTNTYAPADYLEKIFTEAMADEDVAVLSVATRPDCLPEETLDLLERLNRVKPVWVELGLQTVQENTACLIRRGYELPCFERAVRELRERKIEVIVHTILGLPGEGRKEIFETIRYLNGCEIQGIKLQLLHILKGTELGRRFEAQNGHPESEDLRNERLESEGLQSEGQQNGHSNPPIRVMEMEEYVELVIDCLERLSPEIVVHRLTGDGPRELLLAPLWSCRKRTVLNRIHSRMKERNTWQGRCAEVPKH
ncbi:MAG: TIGR01212 family radical SAM protein [Eubacteriales bacterium]|nr:TIGR01212 family radical SAM protein [Eubacteriales bacterium]